MTTIADPFLLNSLSFNLPPLSQLHAPETLDPLPPPGPLQEKPPSKLTIFPPIHPSALVNPLALNHIRPQHQRGIIGDRDLHFGRGARGRQGAVLVEFFARVLPGGVQDAQIV